MPFENLRFVHASDLNFDAPLRRTGPLPEEVFETAAEATLLAWNNVVAACMEEDADFLLLTGRSFASSEISLASELALSEGVQQLGELGIQVFIAPRNDAEAAIWKSLHGLSNYVTVLANVSDDPVAVLRDSHVIATLQRLPEGTAHSPLAEAFPGEGRTRPYVIGISHSAPADMAEAIVDYHAVVAGDQRRTDRLKQRIAHNPGAVQGLEPGQTGVRGCTLIEVSAGGEVECSLLPTAPLRWVSFSLEADKHTSWDELIDNMSTELAGLTPNENERVWLVRWSIGEATATNCSSAHVPLLPAEATTDMSSTEADSVSVLESLCDEDFQKNLLELLEQSTDEKRTVHIVHSFAPNRTASMVALGDDQAILGDFLESVDAIAPLSNDALLALIDEKHLASGPWMSRLKGILGELDPREITSAIRSLGIRQLTGLE